MIVLNERASEKREGRQVGVCFVFFVAGGVCPAVSFFQTDRARLSIGDATFLELQVKLFLPFIYLLLSSVFVLLDHIVCRTCF